jgi:hypothetical protein
MLQILGGKIMARYQNMEAATSDMGYGKLTNDRDIRHACGITDTKHLVWLPIMCDPDNNWYNMYNNNDHRKKELIIQIANKDQAKKDWRTGILKEDRTHVIVRFNKDVRNTYEYEYIGEYCTVLFYTDKYTSIHAKLGSSFANGKVLHGRDESIRWISGFAHSEAEAIKRLWQAAGPLNSVAVITAEL